MRSSAVWIALIAGIVCFVAGFSFANYLNRSELSGLRGENERLKTSQSSDSSQVNLSEEEIEAKLAEANQNSGNFVFQKSLGLGLYRYGAIKKDKAVIEKALPVLVRAHGLDANDYDVIVGLGNTYYDIGYFGKDNASFERSREFYKLALTKRPDDIEIRTDLGLTFFLQEPPDYPAAITEFDKSLSINPQHEKTLSFAALAMKNQNKDAGKYSNVLRTVNPNSPTLREIDSPQPPTQ
jgi:tetratricopeptide (TPR) repeat protein